MNPIVAGHEGIEAYEGLAVDLPAIEPDAADLIAIEADLFELVDDRLAELDVQVATYGNVDELATRRYRRRVRAALRTGENAEVAA